MRTTRRAFLADLGKGLSAAVIVACSGGTTDTSTSSPVSTPGSSPSSTLGSTTTASSGPAPSSTTAPASDGYAWSRVDLDFVSAYILVRAGEAVLVDTGVSGSEGAVEATLTGLGLGWDAVGHVIVTHEHGDHAGSARAILELATSATGYAAQPDLANIATSRPLTEISDGDDIEGLRIIATPGHTAGHVAVLDPGRILLTGDALNNSDGTLTGPNPRFSSDMDTALASARMLADFDYEVALFGHGEPIESGASDRIADLAETL